MIPLNFGLFWSGGKISYLRYISFKSLRYFHPYSKIDLYVSRQCNKTVHKWAVEKQDFEEENSVDYLSSIKDCLGVNVIEMDYFGNPNFCPILQADMFRFWFLYNFGGFYVDSDQLFLKTFDTLPLNKEFIYSQFANLDRPQYSPTGILGCSKGCYSSKMMMDIVPKGYSPSSYNSSGPFIFEYAINNMGLFDGIDVFNAPVSYFYPISCSKNVDLIYNGEFIIPKESYAIHYYLGHPMSQDFNSKYTEDFAQNSSDSLSRFLRDKGII